MKTTASKPATLQSKESLQAAAAKVQSTDSMAKIAKKDPKLAEAVEKGGLLGGIQAGGGQMVASGGVANFTQVKSGGVQVISGGLTSGDNVSAGGEQRAIGGGRRREIDEDDPPDDASELELPARLEHVDGAGVTVKLAAPELASGGGTLTPSQTSLILSAASGSSTSAQITLSNNSGNTVTFSIPTPTTTSGGAWLTASANSNTVTAGGFATLTIQAPNGLTLASGTYYGTVTITPTGGGSSSQIGVTFTVGRVGEPGI